MNSKKILLIAFVFVALFQLFIPVKMIWDKEQIFDSGVEFRFKAAPVDPIDPFRGKYIVLNFEENFVPVENETDWSVGSNVYVVLGTDKDGFAKLISASKEKPNPPINFLKTKVSYVSVDRTNKLQIDYPFDKFYMEESKAYDAELLYRETQLDTTKLTYALVNIKNGIAVLKDVLIDDSSIRELVLRRQNEN